MYGFLATGGLSPEFFSSLTFLLSHKAPANTEFTAHRNIFFTRLPPIRASALLLPLMMTAKVSIQAA